MISTIHSLHYTSGIGQFMIPKYTPFNTLCTMSSRKESTLYNQHLNYKAHTLNQLSYILQGMMSSFVFNCMINLGHIHYFIICNLLHKESIFEYLVNEYTINNNLYTFWHKSLSITTYTHLHKLCSPLVHILYSLEDIVRIYAGLNNIRSYTSYTLLSLMISTVYRQVDMISKYP